MKWTKRKTYPKQKLNTEISTYRLQETKIEKCRQGACSLNTLTKRYF